MKRLRIAFVLSLLLAILTFGVASAITNGQPDEDEIFPYVGIVLTPAPGGGFYVCSGTAISPTEFLTAAHCFYDDDGNFIGDVVLLSFEYELSVIQYLGTAYPHPEYPIFPGKGLKEFDTHDIAIVNVWAGGSLPGPYASLPEEGVVDDLPMKQGLTVVGYGIHGWIRGEGWPFDDPDWDVSRYYAFVELITSNHPHSDEFMKLSANPSKGKGGTCFGDSGGPALLVGETGVTVLGVTSYVTNINCAGVTYSNRIDLDWALEFIGGGYIE